MMLSPEQQEIDDTFNTVLSMDKSERQPYLDKLGKTYPELARAVGELLATGEMASTLLNASALERRNSLYQEITEDMKNKSPEGDEARLGDMIGPYKLVSVLGRGGRSTVYGAKREDGSIEQNVAIKILRRGIDTDDVIARFHTERQILADLVHPSIASILDAGTTDDGLPYLIMEQIDGENISSYCDQHVLDLRSRLTLFLQVSEAVAYAHRHLVVHRDIKPSNILVSEDAKVTLLDFGISKIIEGDSASPSGYMTRTDVNPLSPDYAAPEQRSGEAITTSTDIYQLGLLLIRLIAGKIPNNLRNYDGKAENHIPINASALIRQQSSHNVELPYDAKTVAGDLDTIIRKAMRYAPENRYASVGDLRQDIGRFLDKKPIMARPPTVGYLSRKFIQRQPWALPVTMLAVFSFLSYSITITVYNERLEVERDQKIAEAERADEIKSFLVDFMRAPDPYEGTGHDVTMQMALANAADKATKELAGRPELQAEIYGTLASVFDNLDLNTESVKIQERRLSLLQKMANRELEVLLVRRDRAHSLFKQGDKETSKADLLKMLSELSASFPLELASKSRTLIILGDIETQVGDTEKGIQYLEEAVSLARSVEPNNDDLLGSALHYLASGYDRGGQSEKALVIIDEAILVRTRLFGPDSIPVAMSMVERATVLDDMGQYEEALKNYAVLLPKFEMLFGTQHQHTLTSMNNWAVTLVALKQYQKAEAIYTDLLVRKREKAQGQPTATVAVTLQNLASLLSKLGRDREAAPMLYEAQKIYKKVLEPGNYRLAYPLLTLARIHERLGEFTKQESVSDEALTILDAVLPRGHVARESAQCRKGAALIHQGKMAEGRALILDAANAMVSRPNTPQAYITDCRRPLEPTP